MISPVTFVRYSTFEIVTDLPATSANWQPRSAQNHFILPAAIPLLVAAFPLLNWPPSVSIDAFETLLAGWLKERRRIRRSGNACRGEGIVVGPVLAARALPLRCAASTVLIYTLLAI
jgi:hypothetical protein